MRTFRATAAMALLGTAVAALAPSAPASAQSGAAAAGDWPCVQRLVPRLEPGQMWSGPPAELPERPPPAMQESARRLVDLKVPAEAVAAEVRAFRDRQPEAERARALGQLFALSLDWLNDERAAVIRGIQRYARGQQALADRIVAENREVERLQDASATPDPAALEQLRAAQQWDTRVYNDRQRSLTLVCEQPVELEQRAFALARAIQEELP